jgi:hypothetical protein
MAYIFKGRLCGYICEECREPISRARVRLYRVHEERNVTVLAAAQPKDTFALLDDEAVRAKESLLIAEAETDDEGNFAFELGENQKYGGEAFEVDVDCGTVPPHHPPRQDTKPVQFSLTVIQPLWRERDRDLIYGWEYCLPARLWCLIRARFGVWVVCGDVTICEEKKDTHVPVPSVRVRAFDVDWLQDDEFGSAVTDAAGHFRIYYTPANFRVTPFSPLINFEWVGGPDMYFRVETLVGTPLLVEPSSKGRTPGRENRGPCTCVHLCVDRDVISDPGDQQTATVFNKIGQCNFLTEIDSGALGDGKTLADDRAFYSTLRLNGVLGKKGLVTGRPIEYTFEVAAYNPTTNALGGYTQIPMSMVGKTNIGTWEHVTLDPMNPYETKNYVLNGTASPTVLVPEVTPDGWVRVPQESRVGQPEGNFAPNGNFINLFSSMLRAFGSIDESAVQAGETAGPPNATLGREFYFSLLMKTREAVTFGGAPVAGSEMVVGTCVRLDVMNTLYDNVAKNGSWVPHTEDIQLCVASLDIQELQGNGCKEITNALTVLYTAAHPNLGGVKVTMTGPGGTRSFTLAAGAADNRFGTATPSGFTVASLPNCAYIVHLEVDLLLTTGDGYPATVRDEVAFCKNAPMP